MERGGRLPSRRRDLVVVGASAGGVEALRELVRGLPPDFDATIFAVLHIAPGTPSILPEILTRAGALNARHPEPSGTDGSFQPRTIYVAPPDRHMIIEGDRVLAVVSGKENRHRPAIDPLFRSAARFHGPRVIGVILTGALDDGTVGLAAVKRMGGLAVVQDPGDALFPSMPRSAMSHVAVDHCVPLAEIPGLLTRLIREELSEPAVAVPDELDVETKLATGGSEPSDVDKLGTHSMFTCPECKGALWELNDKRVLRFRCHVGHALTAESLAADQSEALEATLWAAVRAFEERAALGERMAARAKVHRHAQAAKTFTDRASLAHRQADQVRQLLAAAREAAAEKATSGSDGPETAASSGGGARGVRHP
jgi:two-component system, chemotaxis family, protein-glutamate methylesterase/glutaminase